MANRSAFMREFIAATDPASEKGERLYSGSVSMLVEEQPDSALVIGENEVYLSSIRAEEQKQGHGTLAMEFLIALGRKHQVDILLHAGRIDDDGPSDYELVQFYKKFGFKKCGPNNLMICSSDPA